MDVVLVCSLSKTAMPLAWSVLESLMNASLFANVGYLRLGFISYLEYYIGLMVMHGELMMIQACLVVCQ